MATTGRQLLSWWKKEVLPRRRRGKWRKRGKKWIRKKANQRRVKRKLMMKWTSLRRITALKAAAVVDHRKRQEEHLTSLTLFTPRDHEGDGRIGRGGDRAG